MRVVSTFYRRKRASRIRSQSKAEENARRIVSSNGEKLKKMKVMKENRTDIKKINMEIKMDSLFDRISSFVLLYTTGAGQLLELFGCVDQS